MTTRSHPAGLEEQVVEVKDLVQRTLEKQGLLDHVRVRRCLSCTNHLSIIIDVSLGTRIAKDSNPQGHLSPLRNLDGAPSMV